MKYIIDNINRMAGKYTPHQVFADWVEMSALSIEQVQLMLGHEQIDTTMIYAKTDTKSVKYSHDKYM